MLLIMDPIVFAHRVVACSSIQLRQAGKPQAVNSLLARIKVSQRLFVVCRQKNANPI